MHRSFNDYYFINNDDKFIQLCEGDDNAFKKILYLK